MTDFVLDCSVAMTWCFQDEDATYGDRALDAMRGGATAFVPDLWVVEVANVLLVAERRNRLTALAVDAFVDVLRDLPIVVAQSPGTVSEALGFGRAYGLTAYDGAYLALADALGLPLATLDRQLSGCLARAGIAKF